jgi:hypothetical protein
MWQFHQNRVWMARLLAIATILFGVIFYTVGSAIKPGYSSIRDFISELNARGTPWAETLSWFGFVPLGLLFGSFLIASSPIARVRGVSRIGLWLLWSQPIGFIGTALAPCDLGCPTDGSPSQIAHDFLSLTSYFAGVLAFVLLSFAPRLSTSLRLFFLSAGAIWLAILIIMIQPEVADFRGLLQRLSDLVLAIGLVVIAWNMLKSAPKP